MVRPSLFPPLFSLCLPTTSSQQTNNPLPPAIKYFSGKDIHFLQGVSQSQIYLKKKIGFKIQKMLWNKFY